MTLRRLDQCPFTEVNKRVWVALVKRHYRCYPDMYTPDPGMTILRLADQYRRELPHLIFYPFAVSLVKAMCDGYTMAQWRDVLYTVPGQRAMHKRQQKPR